MLKSMTAYGRAEKSTKQGRFVVEIQSLNRKYLEIIPALPSELSSFEPDIRKRIRERLLRGKVTIRIEVAYENESPVSVSPNLDLVRQTKKAWDMIAGELEITLRPQDYLHLLSKEKDILQHDVRELESYGEFLLQVIDEALDRISEMKNDEGAALEADLRKRIEILNGLITNISSFSSDATKSHKEKLLHRLEEYQEGISEGIEREVALYAERIDITEELTRFQSHLQQFDKHLDQDSGAVGKTLDFIIQELHREANTMGAKSSDARVSKMVVEVKSELERMREQVQNIE